MEPLAAGVANCCLKHQVTQDNLKMEYWYVLGQVSGVMKEFHGGVIDAKFTSPENRLRWEMITQFPICFREPFPPKT
jgi:hypothetical protein